MTLFLVKVIGIILIVLVFPACFLIFSIKNAFKSEESNLSKPVPIDESYSIKKTNQLMN